MELPESLRPIVAVLTFLVPILLWAAVCLWAINWRTMWPVLAEGAWIPATLLVVLVALVWSQIAPSEWVVFGFLPLPNFLWQLLSVAAVVGVGLFCGWLQTLRDWSPADTKFDPPEHGHHDHDHGHGHDHQHAEHAAHAPASHSHH